MKKILSMLFVLSAVFFAACEDDDKELWAAIDDLKQRVEALEGEVAKLNTNVESLQNLYQGAAISSYEKQGDKWVLTLTDGQKIELNQGSVSEAKFPQVGITDDGKWQYKVGEGEWIVIDSEKGGVDASSEDGKTPEFRIDEQTGYWQMKYQGEAETEWKNVLNKAGQPVRAISEEITHDKFFENVVVENGCMVVTLLDGQTIKVPILPDFMCQIATPTEGVQEFELGQTKTFDVTIKGAESTMVTAPEGWKASLSEPANEKASLSVTAPLTVGTRATADNTKDVAILATVNGYALISKIQVMTKSAPVVVPSLELSKVASTDVSLTFKAVLANATSWKYVLLKATEAAPTAESVAATGTLAATEEVKVDALTAATDYVAYAVALDGDKFSTLVTLSMTTKPAVTPAEKDLWQDYQDGKDIMVGKMLVNKTTMPNAQLVQPADVNQTLFDKGGLYFVDNSTPATVELATPASMVIAKDADLVMVGRFPEKKQVVMNVPEIRCSRNVGFMNLHFVLANTASVNLFTNGAAVIPTLNLHLQDCRMEMGETEGRYTIYEVMKTESFGEIVVDNCVVKYNKNHKKQPAFINITTDTKKSVYDNSLIKITNSVLYSETPLKGSVVNMGNNALMKLMKLAIEMKGNTVYNLYTPNVLVRSAYATHVQINQNVMYNDYSTITDKATYLLAVYNAAGDDKTSSVDDNYLCGVGRATPDAAPWAFIHDKNTVQVVNQDAPKSTIVDGAGLPFTEMDAVKGYFPIKRTVVTNPAWGASYESKPWFNL